MYALKRKQREMSLGSAGPRRGALSHCASRAAEARTCRAASIDPLTAKKEADAQLSRNDRTFGAVPQMGALRSKCYS
jgi:hypothetical protein